MTGKTGIDLDVLTWFPPRRCGCNYDIFFQYSMLRLTNREWFRGKDHMGTRALLPIARSQKLRGTDRGFRGIGRLSGLAFAESVTFLTRTRNDRPVTRIVWNGPKLRNRIHIVETERAIRECVVVETLPGSEYPAHFFEVEVGGVGRHAAGLILNREAVRTYIGEVCPVPMPSTFPFASEVETLFGENESPLALKVIMDGELAPMTRRYGETIRFSEDRKDRFTGLEAIHIPSADGNRSAALGWIAHSFILVAIGPQ